MKQFDLIRGVYLVLIIALAACTSGGLGSASDTSRTNVQLATALPDHVTGTQSDQKDLEYDP